MIVLTGAGGLIGREVVKRLLASQHDFVQLSARTVSPSDWLEYLIGRSLEPSVLIHLAAAVPRAPHNLDTKRLGKVTLSLDGAALRIAEWFGCHVVYASGCSLYCDHARQVGANENSPLKNLSEIDSPYLASKYQGDRLFASTGMATILRISTPIGVGVSTSSVLGSFIENAICGNPIRFLGSGLREQNYVDVKDIAWAIEKAVAVKPVETINIAARQPITMKNLVHLLSSLIPGTSVENPGVHDPKDNDRARIDISKAMMVLAWSPVVSLRDSIVEVLDTYGEI